MESPDDIFLNAREMFDPVKRVAYLDQACAGDDALRTCVEAMLRDTKGAEDFFGKKGTIVFARADTHLTEGPGTVIGCYKLLQKIGEGGMGVVYMAEQRDPVIRKVALKIVKLGLDTRQVVARFEAERQALALMDHPNIAKVLEAGATETGRPYFVMELVRGIKVTEYCEQNHLSTDERLDLFVKICGAVQHAHQKGIIHRDLKPSNILVADHDGVPMPRIIDFGIAKATTGQPLTDKTVFTEFEQFIGTPAYMSPEQAKLSGLDIDTRTDIYSLGVLLYELLTGKTPFDANELLAAGLEEMRRTIREVEPVKPSTRLTNEFAAADISPLNSHGSGERKIGADLRRLLQEVRGDLDWIVMKCLEKDRNRRYETANGLAADLQRHLRNEVVIARPPSHLYRLRRLVRRNRVVFAAAGAVALALVIGLSVAIHSFVNERSARAGETKHREIAEERSRQAQASASEAMASELKAKRFLYAADMNLVQQALRVNNVGRARLLLDRHRPANGEPDLRGWEWRYLWQECRSGAQAMLTKRDGVRAFSVSSSPDGAWLAVGYSDGQVELWDVAKRHLARLVQKPFDQPAHVAFSPRGDVLAATMGRSVVKTHNVVTAADTILCTVGENVRDLSFSPDGELLAVLSAGPDLVQVLRVEDGTPVMSYPLPEGGGMHFNNARLSPDKQRLYVSCGAFAEPKVRCVSVPDARLLWEIGEKLNEDRDAEDANYIGFSAMDLSPDGRTLVVATGYGGPARVLDAKTGQRLKKLDGHTGWICELAFSKDGKLLASASADQTLRLWDAATWRPLADPLRGHSQEVAAVAFTKDGRFLASGSKDGVVLLWDINAARPENGSRFLPAHIEKAISLPVGQTVLGRDSKGKWSLIDLVTLGEEPLPPTEISTASGLPRLTPGKWLRASRPETIPRSGLTGVLSQPALSPDHKLVAVASEDGFVGLYEGEKQTPIEIIRGNQGSVFGVAFSADSQRLALASGGREGIEIWDVLTRQVLISLSSPNGLLYSVEFTEDGNTLLVGSREPTRTGKGTCQFWRAPSWTEINEAEHAGGLWPQTEAFRPPHPAPTVPELTNLLEQEYRKRVAASRERPSENPILRDESLADLATLLHQQRCDAEAEPLFRELLANLRERIPQDDDAVLSAVSSLTRVVLSLEESARTASDTAKETNHAQQADTLISEQLALLAQSSARNSKDLVFSLKVAALQVWFGRNADHVAICRRLIQQAEEKRIDASNVGIAELAAQALSLSPSSEPALRSRVLRLVRRAPYLETSNEERALYQQTLGVVEYRSGNDAAAEQAFIIADKCAEQFAERDHKYRRFIQGSTRLFRAMILFRNGKEADARKLFLEAEAQMKPLPADDREVLRNGATEGDLIVWLAYKEAKALLQSEPQAAPAR